MVIAGQDTAATCLSATLRDATRELHTRAERSGIVNDILRGHASRDGYALFARNLVPAYAALEAGLERHRLAPAVRFCARPELYRADRLRADIAELVGSDWATRLALLAEGEAYARRIEAAAQGTGTKLIAHAYARYLGDLSGGQILRRLLRRSPGLPAAALSFYEFPAIADPDGFKADWRRGLDEAPITAAERADIVAEAKAAFTLNIDLSGAVAEALAEADPRRP